MNYNINDIVLSIIIGLLISLVVFFVQNSFLVNSGILTLTVISICAFIIYSIIYLLLKASSFDFFESSISVGYFIGLFIIVLFLILNKIFEYNNKSDRPLQHNQRIQLIENHTKCFEIKYGTFFNGRDTIYRFEQSKTDFEQINSNKPHRIKWLDSCNYVVLSSTKSGASITKSIMLGSFQENNTHLRYSRSLNSTMPSDDLVETIYEINHLDSLK